MAGDEPARRRSRRFSRRLKPTGTVHPPAFARVGGPLVARHA
jgi:hypothetical protein